MTKQGASDTSECLLRNLAPQVLGALTRRFRDFAAAEDAVQEALLAATVQWPREGVPDNPRGWLIQVASRRVIDHRRSEMARRLREEQAATESRSPELVNNTENGLEEDDTLTLLFMCSHPALTQASAIALTLRAVGGLTTEEIARAFFVPEATMAQRISRAKQAIKESGILFQSPNAKERLQRLRSVMHVLYLIFNEGYASSVGPSIRRDDLSHEAIRLVRMLFRLQSDEPEVAGLLALMLLTDARRMARTSAQGDLIPLAHQDRSLWDKAQIAEGVTLLSDVLPKGAVGPYQLQAAIAAVHDEAPRFEDTDWPQILALYDLLKPISNNPMVDLNHAIATAMVHGPSKGLQLLNLLDSDRRIANHHRLSSARAQLLEMAGDREGAIKQYWIAAERATSIPERNYLIMQMAGQSDSFKVKQ